MQTNSSLMFYRLLRTALAACLLCVSFNAKAAPVTLDYSGAAIGYRYQDISSFIPIGTSMGLSLTFNETFSDGTYDFSDNLGPVSGSMSVGALNYVFNSYQPDQYSFYPNGDLRSVSVNFLGSGPAPAGAFLDGFFIKFTPDLTLFDNPLLGFGWTTSYPNGVSITNFGSVEFEGEGTIRAVNGVPEPASLALLGLGLAGLCAIRRRQKYT